MEKGEMRVEANISVALADSSKLGTKVEVKNLNSFRSVERAIDYEVKRMIDLIEDGRADEIIQETRGWNEEKMETFSQRRKETSDDYRYFPEPDLPKLKISEIPEFARDSIMKEVIDLPWTKRARYFEYGLNEKQVEFFVADLNFSKLFDESTKIAEGDVEKIKLLANYISSDLVAWQKELGNAIFGKVLPLGMLKIVDMIVVGDLSSRGAKDTLAIYVKNGGDPKQIAEQNGFIQKSDSETVIKIVEQVIVENPNQVAEFRAGKEAVMQYLLGQGMKLSKGAVNPQVLKDEMLKKLQG
jgi:aspartyl-tRNA(Asn)/glutamyl-tRNA(Gln) amidotransferase subunit B